MTLGLPARIEAKIICEPIAGHWLWKNKPNKKTGYARVFWEGTRRDAHRVVWKLLRGTIPPELELDHLCRVKTCVNPYHLEPVTPGVNGQRGNSVAAINARKTHCPRGHELIAENIYDRPDGRRQCVACNKAGNALRYHKRKQQ